MAKATGKLIYESALERAVMAKARQLVRQIELANGKIDPREIRLIIERDRVLGSVLANSSPERIEIAPQSE